MIIFSYDNLFSVLLFVAADNYFCNFESMCRTWIKTNSKLDWGRISGSTPTLFTGPRNDHTRGDNEGLEIYF